jgi:AP-1 complex subunit gamma-1
MKLTVRMTDPAQIERLRRFLNSRTADLSVEIQQRAVEYTNLFGYDQIRRGVLERMPPPEIREEQRVLGAPSKKRQSKLLKDKSKKPAKQAEQDLLVDLMGGADVPATSPAANGSQNTADLLADILGGDSGISSPALQAAHAPAQSVNTSAIMDLFGSNGATPSPRPAEPASASVDILGGLGSAPSPAPSPSAAAVHTAYNKNDLTLTLQLQRAGNGNAQIQARFRNVSDFSQFSNVGLQAAVPKSQRLQLSAINRSELSAGDEGVQMLKIAATSGVSLSAFYKSTRC